MIRLTTRPGDVVLDPFAGSGAVPAVAGFLGRIGVGLELNRTYYQRLKKSGLGVMRETAALELNGATAQRADKLAKTLLSLRCLKLPRVLFTEISRDDRLGEDARREIIAMVVRSHVQPTRGKASAEVTIVCRKESSTRRLTRVARRALSVPPLSKFGVTTTLAVTTIRRIIRGRNKARRNRWYVYRAGIFNWFDKSIPSSLLEETIQSYTSELKTRIPPIVASDGLRVRPPIRDELRRRGAE
jgi:hypothetical protein